MGRKAFLELKRKMEFIHKKGLHIKNALFIIDSSILNTVTNYPDHLFIKDPKNIGGKRIGIPIKVY